MQGPCSFPFDAVLSQHFLLVFTIFVSCLSVCDAFLKSNWKSEVKKNRHNVFLLKIKEAKPLFSWFCCPAEDTRAGRYRPELRGAIWLASKMPTGGCLRPMLEDQVRVHFLISTPCKFIPWEASLCGWVPSTPMGHLKLSSWTLLAQSRLL